MSRIKFLAKKRAQEIQVSQLRFLVEQDGAAERELKSRLTELFRSEGCVEVAYLTRVAYGDEPESVALCLRAQTGTEREFVEKVGKIFASIFGGHEHLDVIFVSEVQEANLVPICKSFFRAAES